MSSGPQLARSDFLKVGGNGLVRPFRATLPRNSTGRSKNNLMSPRIPWILKLIFKNFTDEWRSDGGREENG
jgi:hypothetical protein